MGGMYSSIGNSTLVGLAREIEKGLAEGEKGGLSLDGSIKIIDRKHLEWEFEDMAKQPKEKRSVFFDEIETLLKDSSNEWFAFYHVHT
jgi:hypothetical protein